MTLARDAISVGGWEANVPDTGNKSCGTVTDEVGHDRNCGPAVQFYPKGPTRFSYKNFLWASEKQLSYKHHCIGSSRSFKILMQGPLWGGFRQDLHKILSQGPVPDHVRTAKGFHRDLLKSLSPRLAQDHAKAADSISLGSPQDLRRRKCKRLWAVSSCQDLEENPTRSPSKDLLLLERTSQELDTRTSTRTTQDPPTRAFIQAPQRATTKKEQRVISLEPLGKINHVFCDRWRARWRAG